MLLKLEIAVALALVPTPLSDFMKVGGYNEFQENLMGDIDLILQQRFKEPAKCTICPKADSTYCMLAASVS